MNRNGSAIEIELRRRCAADHRLGILLAQWEYDRALVEAALATVGHVFPHYSLHDASHSETILERIAATLGGQLPRLSAADLWLLLEVAYLHDSGMVVPDAIRRKDMASQPFRDHLARLKTRDDTELSSAATRLDSPRSPADIFALLDWYFDLQIVYADFVRADHPRRARDVALNPETRQIFSPRTKLLPNRFWHIVGDICKAHGDGREKVVELPRRESALAGEFCHPRFAAFMLRIGDLLDLDSGRFCTVLNCTIPNLPKTSQAHKKKHDGIRHLQIDSSSIEILGIYDDFDAYREADQWFAWLRDELNYVALNWKDIAPDPFVGPLPTPGKIDALLEGQIVFGPGHRPRFEVHREKLLELVEGTNIYEGPEDSARELVQNAIDSTLIRFFYDAISRGVALPLNPAELRAGLKNYPIKVTLSKAFGIDAAEDNVWTLEVADSALGMRESDLRFLLKLGSSKENKKKKAIQDLIPAWAQPSGTFGIGFHSLFQYCSLVTVRTRHVEERDALDVEFRSAKIGDPSVVVRRLPAQGPIPIRAGTRVTAAYAFPESPTSVNLSGSGEASRLVGNYDFVNDASFPYGPAVVFDRVQQLAAVSLCTIELICPAVTNAGSASEVEAPASAERDFLADPGVEVILNGSDLGIERVHLRYRGAPIEGRSSHPMLELECDVLAGDASTLLNISRNKTTNAGQRDINQRLDRAVGALLPEVWIPRAIEANQMDHVARLSLYALVYLGNDSFPAWRDIRIDDSTKVRLGELADASKVVITGLTREERLGRNEYRVSISVVDGVIMIDNIDMGYREWPWLAPFLRSLFLARQLDVVSGRDVYSLGKGVFSQDVTDPALAARVRRLSHAGRVGRRRTLPCPHDFSDLSVPTGAKLWGLDQDPFIELTMVNPFVEERGTVVVPDVLLYVKWLAALSGRDPHLIAVALRTFIEHADALIGGAWGPKTKGSYDLTAILAKLAGL